MIVLIVLPAVVIIAKGSTLSLEPPPPPSLDLNGTVLNLTADDQDRDLAVDPTDDLPANGTQQMSTAGATDLDINIFPPQGVSVIIQNDTVTVTNETVTIGPLSEDDVQAVESNDDGDEDEEE